jgi:hypothetical protein
MIGLFGRLRARVVEERVPEQERMSLADVEALLREIAADHPGCRPASAEHAADVASGPESEERDTFPHARGTGASAGSDALR